MTDSDLLYFERLVARPDINFPWRPPWREI